MKKQIVLAVAGVCAVGAVADVTVNVAPATGMSEYAAEYAYVSDLVKPRRERPQANKVSGTIENGQFVIPQMAEGAARYVIPVSDGEYIMLFTEPGDNLVVNIDAVSPLQYSVTGSALMEDVTKLDKAASEISARFRALRDAGTIDEDAIKAIQKDFNDVYKGYLAAKPDGPAAGFAMMNLEGTDFLDAFAAMTETTKNSLFYPMLVQQQAYEEQAVETQRKREALENGTVDAPNFTLEGLDGKPVSLSDFRGKWVILDFWGSWCRWCIKGIPELKEAYARYAPELEVIGVDCRDSQEAWRNAVKKYDLPWVHVYNPEETGAALLQAYTVEGFPTKAIVNPEGKIVNITVGEDPNFYAILAKFMKK